MNQLSFQKFKKTLTELKEDSPKDTVEYKKLSPAEKQAVKDVFTLLGNTKGEIISKVDSIVKQVAKKRNVKISSIEDCCATLGNGIPLNPSGVFKYTMDRNSLMYLVCKYSLGFLPVSCSTVFTSAKAVYF